MATTKLENLIVPEVIADFVEQKLIDAIKISPLCTVRNDLVGKAGDKVSLPVWQYIGDAGIVNEAEDIPVATLTQTEEEVKILKIGQGVSYTDEALLSGLGGNQLANEATDQIVKSIASTVENTLIANMSSNVTKTVSYNSAKDAAENVAAAVAEFGEDMDGKKVILIPPSMYTTFVGAKGWIPNTELGANILVKGTVGQIMGCDIVVSNRLEAAKTAYVKTVDKTVKSSKKYYTMTAGVAAEVSSPTGNPEEKGYFEKVVSAAKDCFIVKPGALAIYTKRNTMVEFDRDKSAQVEYIYGSKLFAPYVYDPSKIVKITVA